MDKISQLPDELLIKILSLFPAKDVVAMRVLSKRWMSLWTLVPRLIFGVDPEEDDDREEEDAKSDENDHCSHFVYVTLLLHKAPVLERFHLNRVSGCSASEIDLWVRIAVDRFVRDLKIRFFPEYGIIRLPSTLFRCETLEILELRKVIISDVPSRVSFQSLKTFHLLFVKYPDEESFLSIISDCPVLEGLVVETCHDDNVVTFTINVPSLEKFSIRNTLQDLETGDDVFVVHYHSLKELTIVDYFGELKLLGNNNVAQLVEANLLSVSCHAKVLESFSRLQRISLCLPEEVQYPTGIVLYQLVCLEICSCEDNWTNMLVSVLQHSPKLKALKLALKHSVSEDCKLFWTQPSCVPQCLLCHLETFEWRGYDGEEVEKEVAVYILKNASRLVTATIYYSDSFEMERKCRMFKELEAVSRGSRSCKLTMG